MKKYKSMSMFKFSVMGLIASITLWSGNASAASAGSGSAYGLNVNANVLLLGPINLGPLPPAVLQSAPPDTRIDRSTPSASLNAGVLSVSTGVLEGVSESVLAQNSVRSDASVANLALSALTLGLGASTVSATAEMTCVAGRPAPSGSTQIVGGSGLLNGISAPLPNTQLSVLNLGTPIATVYLNEQIVSPTNITVNAIRIELNVIGAITASVTIGQASAAMNNCQPTVTLDPAPLINLVNQSAYAVSGTCSPGSGDVTVTLPGATPPSLSATCTNVGTFTTTFNATPVAEGPVTITATQTDADGNSDSDSTGTTKDTGAPTVTVNSAPGITGANQLTYAGVTGSCSEHGLPVAITIGSLAVTPAPLCVLGVWTAPSANVSGLPDGPVQVSASQTDLAGNTGSGMRLTAKDTESPIVTVLSAPPISAANQSSYSGVTGTCSESGLPVSVSIGGVAVVPPPTCVGGGWAITPVDVSSLPSGPVTVSAEQTDGSGNTGTGVLVTIKDTLGPLVSVITAPPITSANVTNYSGVTGTCSENGRAVAVTIGVIAVSPAPTCLLGAWSAAPTNVTTLPDGTINVSATQTDLAGNEGSAALDTTKDATPPVVTITNAPPITAINQSSYAIAGSCSENGLPVAVTIAGNSVPVPLCSGGTWTVSGFDASALPEASVPLVASQTDLAGNLGSATLNTVKDLTAPNVAVTSAPTINVLNRNNYVVAGTCSEAGLPVTVAIGSIAVVPDPICVASIWTAAGTDVSSLPDGDVLVNASQTDTAGNRGTGSRTTNKDASVPTVTVTSAPIINASNQASYSGVSGSCSEEGRVVSVTIGGNAVSPSPTCTAGSWTAPGVNATTFPEGVVTVTAAQTDAAGNTGTGSRDTLKDLTAPTVTVTAAPAINAANQASYGGVTGTCSENGLPVSVSIGGVSVSPSPTCVGSNWSAVSTNVTSLAEGAVLVTAAQTDIAGNTGSGSRSTLKDITAPTVTVSAAPPINLANRNSYGGVIGTCSENGLPVLVTVGSVAAGSPVCTGSAWTASSVDVGAVPDGVVVVTATQTDNAGNSGTGTRNTVKDATAPTVTVTTAPPINAANQTSYAGVSGTCSENGLAVTVTVGSLNISQAPICAGGGWAAAPIDATSLPEGTVTVTAAQTDVAGNSANGTRDTLKDITLPVVTVTAAPAIAGVNQASYTGVVGTCSENGLPVSVSVGGIAVAPSPTCGSGVWTAAAVNVTSLADGTVTVNASQTDNAGNVGTGTRNTNKDATAPSVTVTSAPIINASNQTNYTGVSGACSENGQAVLVSIASVSVSPAPSCTAGAWSAAATDVSGLPEGAVLVTASQTDALGNVGTGTRNTSKDLTAPNVTITSAPPITKSNYSDYRGIVGTCSENGAPVSVTVGTITMPTSPICTANAWNASGANVASLPDGEVLVVAWQTDAGGNVGRGTRMVAKDVAPPAVSVETAPSIDEANHRSYAGVSGTCSENDVAVSVWIGKLIASPAPMCQAGSWSAPSIDVSSLQDGTVMVVAEQTDALGNVGSGERETVKRTALITNDAGAVAVSTLPPLWLCGLLVLLPILAAARMRRAYAPARRR